MGTLEILNAAVSDDRSEEDVPVNGGVIRVRRAPAHEVISATKLAVGGDEAKFRLAVTALSICDGDARPLVDPDGSLDRGIGVLEGLPGGLQLALCGAALRVNGFHGGN